METVLEIGLPAWFESFFAEREVPVDDASRVAEVLALAMRNVSEGTGGPFAAAVYESDGGARLSAAVNVVVAAHCSLAHAETMALALAQRQRQDWTLANRSCVLVSSAEPCAMCLGAMVWSGVSRLVYAATRAEVQAIGFDEGPRPARWRQALRLRGIEVEGPVARRRAREPLAAYLAGGGPRYNGR